MPRSIPKPFVSEPAMTIIITLTVWKGGQFMLGNRSIDYTLQVREAPITAGIVHPEMGWSLAVCTVAPAVTVTSVDTSLLNSVSGQTNVLLLPC